MPYVQRQNGKITGRFANAQPGYAEEWLDDTDPELQISIKDKLLPDLRVRRDLAINVLDGLQSDALASGETSVALDIKAAKQACRDIPALNVSAATTEAEMRALYLAEWRRITGLVPASVRASFALALA